MEEIQSQSDNYRSSSSSASSPTATTARATMTSSRVPLSNFYFLRKPGSLRQPISFEDSPEWEDTEIHHVVQTDKEEEYGEDEEDGDHGDDSIHAATTTATVSPALSKLNSGSLPSLQMPESSTAVRKIAGASIVWKDLTVTIKGKRKYSDKVVKSSNGYALPGTLTVIMGPAKSGKSTLLRALSGRLQDPAKMFGEVFVNGAKSSMPYGSYCQKHWSILIYRSPQPTSFITNSRAPHVPTIKIKIHQKQSPPFVTRSPLVEILSSNDFSLRPTSPSEFVDYTPLGCQGPN
ncbi:Abc transporter g family member [Thalictrum thalictroides]|uniref:Abc transporter g family member n=1 Tax=Thalictrum thalictroides TaxID=46969 RepID=A0A7J6VH85_THATH|nr:Abc transporter g family member [Thalictrum thalictroides]